MSIRMTLLVTALAACSLECSETESTRPRPPAAEPGLPVDRPENHGVDGAALLALAGEIRDGGNDTIHALLVLRHGHLLFEAYFDGWDRDRLHEIQSISKGVVSLCVGIALERGVFESLDQRVVDFFPDLEIENRSAWKEAITIGDILRMSTGSSYSEGGHGSAHWRLNRMDRGWTKFWLDQPMAFEPLTGWHYDSGGVIALSEIFQRMTGVHVDDYARVHLFEPLGIEEYRWERNAEGHPHAGGGLHLRPRDLAKIGQLILQGGRWQGRQVVPGDWIARSTRTKFRFAEEHHPIVGYAYLWWVFAPAEPGGTPIGAGTGLGGQYLFWVPEHQLVVVIVGWSDDADRSRWPVQLLYRRILPAVSR